MAFLEISIPSGASIRDRRGVYSFLGITYQTGKIGGEHCVKFRPNVRTTKKKGMTHFYYDMPGRIEKAIRQELIRHFGRTQYFEMRNGTRLISADDEAAIATICRSHGWEGPFVYDGEEDGLQW